MAVERLSTRRIILRPLVPLAIALQAGIAAGVYLPGHCCAGAVLFAAAGGAVAWRVLTRRPALILPLLLTAAAGYLSIQPWLGRALPDDHVARYAGKGKLQVAGTVADDPEGNEQRRQFTLQAERVDRGAPIAVRGKIRISTGGELAPLQRGDRARVIGHMHQVRGFCNPEGFAYERFMALQNIHARLYARGEVVRVEPAPAPDWHARLDRLRGELRQQMSAALQGFPPAAVQLLQALTLGERSGLDAAIQESFSRAGVSHVLAISGLHVGMVAAAALAFFSRLLVWVPVLLERGWVRRAAAAATMAPVIGYGLLAGLSPSTQRAMIVVAAFLLTFWIGRDRDWLNLLALAALLILIVAPPALMSISFQLSFAAVLAILIGMRRLPLAAAGPSASLRRRLLLWALSSMAVTLLATWGTAPLVMRYFNQVSWVGPLGNLFVVPLVGAMVLPAGLLGIACSPFSSLLSGLCWKAAALVLEAMIGWVDALAAWEWAGSVTVTPTLLEVALFYFLSALLCLWRYRTLRMVGLALFLLAAAADTVYWVQRRFSIRQMTVTAVDVGQGSANVLQLPGGRTVLVDGGGFSDDSVFDIGRSVVAPFLWSNKIRTIDLVVLTHPNSDHLNGLMFILRRFKVLRIWSNHEEVATQGWGQWRQLIAERGIEHPPLDRLPARTFLGPVQFTLLGPAPGFLELRGSEPWRNTNNNSMVLRAAWNDISFLFTGDIMAEAEKELLMRHAAERLRSTVLFVPHHGSNSSGTAPFIQAVGARENIIAAGWRNRFGFPHLPLLQRLSQTGGRIWRTDQCGAVTIRTDGTDYQIQTCRRIASGDKEQGGCSEE